MTPSVVKNHFQHLCIEWSSQKNRRKPFKTQKNMFFSPEIWRVFTVRAKKSITNEPSYLEKISWNQRCSEYIHIPQELFWAKFLGPIFHNRYAKLTDVVFRPFSDIPGRLPGVVYFLEKILWNQTCLFGWVLQHIKFLSKSVGPFTSYRFFSPDFDVSRRAPASVYIKNGKWNGIWA